jgi:hypothetical protein
MGGVPLLVRTFRSLGLPVSIRKQVGVKQRERGLDEAEMVESFVVLNAMGGECFDDYRKQQSGGLAQQRGGTRLSADVGRVGGDERGRGRRVSRRQCARDIGPALFGQALLLGLAGDRIDFFYRGDSAGH